MEQLCVNCSRQSQRIAVDWNEPNKIGCAINFSSRLLTWYSVTQNLAQFCDDDSSINVLLSPSYFRTLWRTLWVNRAIALLTREQDWTATNSWPWACTIHRRSTQFSLRKAYHADRTFILETSNCKDDQTFWESNFGMQSLFVWDEEYFLMSATLIIQLKARAMCYILKPSWCVVKLF